MTPDRTDFDEIPDSLFRDMVKGNFILLALVFLICCIVSLFIYFKVLDSQFKVIRYIRVEHDGQALEGHRFETQKYIRLLKSDLVRNQIIKRHDLVDRFGIDTTKNNHLIMLDKVLYDRMRVEEQGQGEILVSFIDCDIKTCERVLEDLVHTALLELKTLMKNDHLTVQWHNKGRHTFKVSPKLLSLLLAITTPVMLAIIIFIAVKEKLYINLQQDD